MNRSAEKPAVSTGRKIYGITMVFSLIYCSVGIALYHLQEKFLFHPKALPKDFHFQFDIPFKEVNIPITEVENLNLIQFLPSGSIRKGVVIYFHGNSDNVTRYAKHATNFTKNGYEVWMPDYPGYGKTTGKLTEENFYSQAKEVYKLAHSRFSADSIIVYGKSLGSGIASHIAANYQCKRLILETPFYSIVSLYSHYAPIYPVKRMSHFDFPVGKNLKDVKAPVTIFHGTDDEVIPLNNALKLKKELKPGDEFLTIEGGAHNDLVTFPFYQLKLDSLLNL